MILYRRQRSRPSPRKRNTKSQNGCLRLFEEALQIAEEKRGAKGKREKERYTDLNAEFQRIARRNEKVFLHDQCKEIEENNRIERTRDLFKRESSPPPQFKSIKSLAYSFLFGPTLTSLHDYCKNHSFD